MDIHGLQSSVLCIIAKNLHTKWLQRLLSKKYINSIFSKCQCGFWISKVITIWKCSKIIKLKLLVVSWSFLEKVFVYTLLGLLKPIKTLVMGWLMYKEDWVHLIASFLSKRTFSGSPNCCFEASVAIFQAYKLLMLATN